MARNCIAVNPTACCAVSVPASSEYFDLDPTLIRLAWALVCFLGGSGILAYIIAAIIIPSESTRNNNMM